MGIPATNNTTASNLAKVKALPGETPDQYKARLSALYSNNQSNIASTVASQYKDAQSGQIYDNAAGADALAALRNQRSPEAQAIIGTAMDQTQGINAQENQALRQNALASVNSQNQSALHALAAHNAANGVRGGVARAQNAGQRAQATSALAQSERDLVAQNIAAKQAGLKTAATIVNTQENAEKNQAADKLATIMGVRGQNVQLQSAKLQADATPAGGK